jgi:hypothetical protein
MQGATSHAEFDDGLIVSQPPTKIWEAELKENVIVAIVCSFEIACTSLA